MGKHRTNKPLHVFIHRSIIGDMITASWSYEKAVKIAEQCAADNNTKFNGIHVLDPNGSGEAIGILFEVRCSSDCKSIFMVTCRKENPCIFDTIEKSMKWIADNINRLSPMTIHECEIVQ